jgi:hypothetical protein
VERGKGIDEAESLAEIEWFMMAVGRLRMYSILDNDRYPERWRVCM